MIPRQNGLPRASMGIWPCIICVCRESPYIVWRSQVTSLVGVIKGPYWAHVELTLPISQPICRQMLLCRVHSIAGFLILERPANCWLSLITAAPHLPRLSIWRNHSTSYVNVRIDVVNRALGRSIQSPRPGARDPLSKTCTHNDCTCTIQLNTYFQGNKYNFAETCNSVLKINTELKRTTEKVWLARTEGVMMPDKCSIVALYWNWRSVKS